MADHHAIGAQADIEFDAIDPGGDRRLERGGGILGAAGAVPAVGDQQRSADQ